MPFTYVALTAREQVSALRTRHAWRPWASALNLSTIQETRTQRSEKQKLLETVCLTNVSLFSKRNGSLGLGLFQSALNQVVAARPTSSLT